jgi:hypothetical protein
MTEGGGLGNSSERAFGLDMKKAMLAFPDSQPICGPDALS